MLRPEGFLEWVEVVAGRRHPFDGRHLVTVSLGGEHEAGTHGETVEEHGAGSAHAVLTADMRARQVEILTQEVGERRAQVHVSFVVLAIDVYPDGPLHAGPRQRRRAAASTRPASVAATVLR